MKTDHYLGFNFQLLAKHKGLQWNKILRLEEVQAQLGISLEEMLSVTEDALHSDPYSPEEICMCLGISLEELRTQILSPNTRDGEFVRGRSGYELPPFIAGRFSNFLVDSTDCKAYLRELRECIYIGKMNCVDP